VENDNEIRPEAPPAPAGESAAPAGESAAPAAEVSEPRGDDAGEGSNAGPALGPDGLPRKRRRRGKRGGKRHRKKTPGVSTGEAAPNGDEPGEPGETAVTAPDDSGAEVKKAPARARQPQRRRQPARAPARKAEKPDEEVEAGTPAEPSDEKPASRGRTREAASAEAGAGEAGADEAATDEGGADEAGADGAPRKRRRRGKRGGQGRKKPAAEGGDEAAGDKAPAADEASAGDKAPAKRAPGRARATGGGSTRLKARAIRNEQQKGRRRPRRLTEEDAARLRGGKKVMLIHEHEDRTQIALLEEGTLIEHFVSRKGEKTTMTGNVFLGRVQNVLPSMEAAFVDFGRGRNGVLYAGEVNYSLEDLEGELPRIEKVLKSGQSLMVQVTKDPIGNKGARLTTQISLAGRYMVLAPEQQVSGISRRLADKERSRLRLILREIAPNGHGVIVRTAAEGASREALERDLTNLIKTWEDIQRKAKRAKAPHLLYAEPELVSRVVRDIFAGEVTQMVVDSRGTFEEIRAYLDEQAPDMLDRLTLHEGPLQLFESYRVAEQLHKALERKVWLPSGGSLVIDKSEAMTVIDVNTGKFTGKGSNLEETVFKNNLEAAEEVARQLRLRDIGGIIVIDFIDMIDPNNQKEVLRTLKRALSTDKTRSQVFDVTNLGLVEMTRKRVSEGLLEAFSEPCPNCEGRGIVMTHEID